MLAMGPRDLNSAPYSPVHCSSHSMTSFQSSELTELPVVENSQLFAQRAHSARTAHGTPPKTQVSDSRRTTQWDQLEDAPPKPTVQRIYGTNAWVHDLFPPLSPTVGQGTHHAKPCWMPQKSTTRGGKQ